MEQSKSEDCILSALSKKYAELLEKDLWQTPIPIILTSGTMSASGDFSYLKHTAGLKQQKEQILEINTVSPFNYNTQAMLYLPHSMPFPNNKDTEYMQAVLEQLEELIVLTHGHTLVLFTSYKTMEKAFIKISKRVTDFPLFMMGRGKINVLSEFRNSGNGVLFASDSAGEGIDLAGDILSSLIVVKLPFPIPDAVSEYEISKQDNFESYLTDSIIPTMLIKLRQWICRGIRRETDTCVFSILDSRASKRYFREIRNALPSVPITRDILDVGRFMLNRKSDEYFK